MSIRKSTDEVWLNAIMIVCVISILGLLFNNEAHAECNKIYTKTGLGFKLDSERFDNKYRNDPYFLRFEGGIECENLIFGISHGRQIYTDDYYFDAGDNYKTALFIDYKFQWGL